VLLVSLRDLRWRKKRVVVAVLGTSVVMALTLILAGVSASFPNEARRSVDALHAAAWVVPQGTAGPFMSSATIPTAVADQLQRVAGPGSAVPVAILRATAHDGQRDIDANVLGVVPGAFTDPPVTAGRAPQAPGEATADRRLDIAVGSTITLSGRVVHVVGLTSGLTYRAGVGSLYIPLADAQAVAYGGHPIATTIAMRVVPVAASLPPGLVARTNADARADLLAPIVNARKTINLVLALLWLVAGLVIGSVVYLSAVDRVRELAVFKAVGATNRAIVGGVLVQAIVLGAAACAMGAVLSRLIGPAMPMKAEIAGTHYLELVVGAALVALLASVAAIRRALSVDPALAFAGA